MAETPPVSEIGKEFYLKTLFDTVGAILNSANDSISEFLGEEIKRLIRRITEDPDMANHIKEIVPYLFAGAFLSYAAREINRDNIAKVFEVIGFPVDDKIVDLLLKMGLENHLVYIYAYYFLLVFGKVGTETEVLNMVKVLGIKPNEVAVKEILSFLYLRE